MFLSGDRHLAEISRLDSPGNPPRSAVTSSGLTHSWTTFPGEPNRLRVGSVFHQLNFGLLVIHWRTEPAVVDLQILDVRGAVVRSARLSAPADPSFEHAAVTCLAPPSLTLRRGANACRLPSPC